MRTYLPSSGSFNSREDVGSLIKRFTIRNRIHYDEPLRSLNATFTVLKEAAFFFIHNGEKIEKTYIRIHNIDHKCVTETGFCTFS
ncbi:unnamed protein product [Haemonchus placei]|uniref:Uncharacterized protein n=1 Tax=Haemonchus placei TaxID=6290 RepID=A0A3P7T8A5_HAEPC|nr:unnamed protein product [Haemonchus placei]